MSALTVKCRRSLPSDRASGHLGQHADDVPLDGADVGLDLFEIAALQTAVANDLTARYGKGHWSSTVSERGVLFHMRTGRVYVLRSESRFREGETSGALRREPRKWARHSEKIFARRTSASLGAEQAPLDARSLPSGGCPGCCRHSPPQ